MTVDPEVQWQRQINNAIDSLGDIIFTEEHRQRNSQAILRAMEFLTVAETMNMTADKDNTEEQRE